jgi:hypothetical protein
MKQRSRESKMKYLKKKVTVQNILSFIDHDKISAEVKKHEGEGWKLSGEFLTLGGIELVFIKPPKK